MKDKKKIIGIITLILLLVILIIIVILVATKNKKIAKPEEPMDELYIGTINCTLELSSEEKSKTYLLDEIEVKEGIVQSRGFQYKIIYLDKENYEGFKKNEEVENPEYDDVNLTIKYGNEEKQDLTKYNIAYENLITDLKKEGYSCSLDK